MEDKTPTITETVIKHPKQPALATTNLGFVGSAFGLRLAMAAITKHAIATKPDTNHSSMNHTPIHKQVGETGFEPATSCFQGKRELQASPLPDIRLIQPAGGLSLSRS